MSISRDRYRLYGLRIESPLALPAPRFAGSGPIDVRFKPARTFPEFRERTSKAEWFHYHATADGGAYLRWEGLFEFLVSPDGRVIHYHRLRHATDESFATYLLGQVLSFSMVATQSEPLHGTCVTVPGGAIGFLGNCGAGKSTLAAALLARGCRLITDDLVSLAPRGGGFMVETGPPRLKLYPRVAQKLIADHGAAPMHHLTAKRVFPLAPDQSTDAAAPLRVLYVLHGKSPRTNRRAVSIEPLSRAEAMVELVRASFNLTVTRSTRLRTQFAQLSRVADAVPVKRLRYCRAFDALPSLLDAILSDNHS